MKHIDRLGMARAGILRAWPLLFALSIAGGCGRLGDSDSTASAGPPVTQGDTLVGIRLGPAEYERYLSARETQELRFLADRPDQLKELALDYHSDVVLAKHAEARGLDDDPLVRERIARARRDVLVRALAEQVEAAVAYPAPETLERLAWEQYQRGGDEAFTKPARRRVAHILIGPNNHRLRGTDETLASIMAEVRTRLDAGEPFAALAEAYSDDPGSWRRGGELAQPVQRDGKTVEAFENAVFALEEVGAVSEPVRTTFGLHLIKLLEIIEPEPIPFADVREALIANEKAKLRSSALEKLRASAYPDLATIDVAALQALAREAVERREAGS